MLLYISRAYIADQTVINDSKCQFLEKLINIFYYILSDNKGFQMKKLDSNLSEKIYVLKVNPESENSYVMTF